MKIGFVAGAFDLLHVGHLHFLESARDKCDHLIVGLHSNPTIDRPTKNKPIQTLFERWTQLNCLSCVDSIIPYDTEYDLTNLLATQTIHVRFLGSDYNDDMQFTGKDLCKFLGIEIVYIPRHHFFSTTELRKRIENAAK